MPLGTGRRILNLQEAKNEREHSFLPGRLMRNFPARVSAQRPGGLPCALRRRAGNSESKAKKNPSFNEEVKQWLI